jgi:hypothetical protein
MSGWATSPSSLAPTRAQARNTKKKIYISYLFSEGEHEKKRTNN